MEFTGSDHVELVTILWVVLLVWNGEWQMTFHKGTHKNFTAGGYATIKWNVAFKFGKTPYFDIIAANSI